MNDYTLEDGEYVEGGEVRDATPEEMRDLRRLMRVGHYLGRRHGLMMAAALLRGIALSLEQQAIELYDGGGETRH